MNTLNPHSDDDLFLINSMVFHVEDVLTSAREKVMRSANLMRAAVLDNVNNVAVVLIVQDCECQRKLRSRIIATGDQHVLLENGLTIPMNCISHIEFPCQP